MDADAGRLHVSHPWAKSQDAATASAVVALYLGIHIYAGITLEKGLFLCFVVAVVAVAVAVVAVIVVTTVVVLKLEHVLPTGHDVIVSSPPGKAAHTFS